jgi:hypothetical protein
MFANQRGAICNSNSAILCNGDGSFSPSLAELMVSAIASTCAVLTVSGGDAIATSRERTLISFIVSGGKDAFESLSSLHVAALLLGILVGNLSALVTNLELEAYRSTGAQSWY